MSKPDASAQISKLIAGAPEPAKFPCILKADGDPIAEPVVHELVGSFLCWEAGVTFAADACERIAETFVDLNELRVSFEDEISGVLGKDDPIADERAARLRTALNSVFQRENSVSLASLVQLPKREARQYLEAIDGVPQYVAARVSLRALGAHAMPCDSRLLSLLHSEEIATEHDTPESAGSWLERQIRAGDSLGAHHAFEALLDGAGAKRPKKTSKRGA